MAQPVDDLKQAVSVARVIPVLVLDDVSIARPLAQALVAGGLNVIEVTFRTPNALDIMREMVKVKGTVVGSGTVRTVEHMRMSEEVGCRFMVSPGASRHLLEEAENISIPLLPGVASPSEAMSAAEMGYSFLKFFPAEAMGGAPVLKSFASPFPDLSFCPTGGIDAHKAADYLDLPNVLCVGGSWVTPKALVADRDFTKIEKLAHEANRIST